MLIPKYQSAIIMYELLSLLHIFHICTLLGLFLGFFWNLIIKYNTVFNRQFCIALRHNIFQRLTIYITFYMIRNKYLSIINDL